MIGGTLRCRGAHIKRQKLTFIVITSAQFNDEARATVPVVDQAKSLSQLAHLVAASLNRFYLKYLARPV
jgi:hypothetical protein